MTALTLCLPDGSENTLEIDAPCADCGRDTVPEDSDQWEYYMVSSEVWKSITPKRGRRSVLCIGCLEERLGRTLEPADFPSDLVNLIDSLPRSARLAHRMGRR